MKGSLTNSQRGFIPGLEGLAVIVGLLASMVLLSLNSARAKARDAKRLADIRQLSAALELYKNDKNRYPDSLSALSPVYIGIVPTAPLPADGACTPEQNAYNYHKTNHTAYQLTFCLGGDTGGLRAGARSLNPSTIQ